MTGMATPRGPEIEAMRKKRGLKRSELATLINVSYQHVYGIERGFNTATEEILQRIAMEFDVKLEDVMAPAKPEPRRVANPTSSPEPERPVAPPRPTKTPAKRAGSKTARTAA